VAAALELKSVAEHPAVQMSRVSVFSLVST